MDIRYDRRRPGVGAVGQAPKPAGDPFALCAALLRAGDPAASAALGACSARRPGNAPGDAEGWLLLGDALAELGRAEAAAVCLARALRGLRDMADAPAAELALRAGVALRALGRAGEARAAFAAAAARDPGSVRARFLAGAAAQDAGDFDAAAAAYEAALRLDPGLGEAALNLGTVRQAQGDLARARRAYGRAARLRPDGFARAAQALTTASKGELWLDLGALRRELDGPAIGGDPA